MPRTLFIFLIALCSALSAEPFRVVEFDQKVLPMVERYCIGCHDTATAKGDFDLGPFLTPAARDDPSPTRRHAGVGFPFQPRF